MTLDEQLAQDAALYGFNAVLEHQDGTRERVDPRSLRWDERGECFISGALPITAKTLRVHPTEYAKSIECEIRFQWDGGPKA